MSADAVAAMLRARSIALVGASARPNTMGARMITEVGRSRGRQIHLVNPRYDMIDAQPCAPSLTHLDKGLDAPIDLALLAVRDEALKAQLAEAARTGVRSAVIFGNAHGSSLRETLREIATGAGMALCGAGCMGFVNVTDGLRAIGYLERSSLPAGPVALITHSGSVFSALLRTRRALGFTIAVSSGQELVTTTADYLEHVLDNNDTRVVALVLETVRDGPRLVAALRRAADRNVAVVLLPIGGSPLGSELVSAHSGALAGDRAMWEALGEGTGALLVGDLAELTDTLELLALAPRARHNGGIATVHDSGAERTLVADLAQEIGVPFAPLSSPTLVQLDALLDDGLLAANPLDLWGTRANTRALFTAGLSVLARDPSVAAVALAVDLLEEYDGDTSYIDTALDFAASSDVPFAVLTNLASALDTSAATRLRAAGVPVLEGTRSGLVALKHLLALAGPRSFAIGHRVDVDRQRRWRVRFDDPRPLDGAESFALLADYGVPAVSVRAAYDEDAAVAAADALGYPVVLKTDSPGVAHKSDVAGVVVGLRDAPAVRDSYRAVSTRLGARVLVCATAPDGVEVALGIVRDPQLGPLVVVGAGGVLTELLSDRVVALPTMSHVRARRLLARLRMRALLAGWRGAEPADLGAVAHAVVGISTLADELGDRISALDVNPLIAGPWGAIAVDVLVVPTAAN